MTEEKDEPQSVELTALDLDQLISIFIGILSTKAWQYMGIRLTPVKNEAEKDMAKASTAIDCITFLVDKIAPGLTDEDVGKLRTMVADLQINYAKKV